MFLAQGLQANGMRHWCDCDGRSERLFVLVGGLYEDWTRYITAQTKPIRLIAVMVRRNLCWCDMVVGLKIFLKTSDLELSS